MDEEKDKKKVPESCWVCPYSVNCYSWYGGSTCKYRLKIEEMELKKGGT